MKCPKCGHDNADGDIFCSECDWQLNKAYKPETKVQKVVVTTYVGLVFGVAALIVLCYHHFDIYGTGSPVTAIFNHGYLAVDFFFIPLQDCCSRV